jgi:hypothetical protein
LTIATKIKSCLFSKKEKKIIYKVKKFNFARF